MKLAMQGKAMNVFGILLACAAMIGCAKNEATAPAAAAATAPTAAPAEKQEQAHAVLIVAPGKAAPADLARNLAGWKSDGALTNVVLVKKFGSKEKEGYSPGFEEFAVLDFASEQAYENWKASSAAGLGPDVTVSRVDVLLDRRSKNNDPAQSIYVISQYESLISAAEYQDYTTAYIEPNMANQMFSGIMTRYTMYLERAPSGGMKNPKAILVTEYANQSEYDRKESVKDAYKVALLSTHPEWTRINDVKRTMRTDLAETYANPVKL